MAVTRVHSHSPAADTLRTDTTARHAIPLRRHHHRLRRGRRHALPPSGAFRQAHPPSRAWRLRAPRARELEHPRRQRRGSLPDEGALAGQGGQDLHPHTNYWVGGNTKFYGAALFRLRREDFGELRHHGGVSPAWPISYDELEPYYTEAEHLYQVHGERGRRPDRAAGERAVPASAGQSRAADPAASEDFARLGCKPVPCAARHHAQRGRPAPEQVHPLRHVRRPSLPGHGQVRRAGGVRRPDARPHPERHPAHRRVRLAARDRCIRTRGDAGRRGPGRPQGGLFRGHRGRLRRRHQFGGAAAPLGERPASARPGERVGRGGPALHGPHQLGAHGAVPLPQPDDLPEDASRSTTSISARRSGRSRWGTSPSWASSTA